MLNLFKTHGKDEKTKQKKGVFNKLIKINTVLATPFSDNRRTPAIQSHYTLYQIILCVQYVHIQFKISSYS